MRRLPQQFAFRNSQSMRDDVEADNLSLTQHGQALATIAVSPFHMVRFLSRRFDQIPQERRLIFG